MINTIRNFTYDRYWGIFKYKISNSLQPVRIYAGIGTSMDNIVLGTTDPIVGYGYSGANLCINDPSLSRIHDMGCIPAGFYTFQGPLDDPEMGQHIWRLVPDSANQMFERADFYNHGDNKKCNHSASKGCIVSPEEVRVIFRNGDRLQVL